LLYWSTLALLLVSVVFALGQNIPGMSQIITFLPGASFLRFPSKLLFFAVFSLALLAARGGWVYLKGEAPLVPHMIGWLLLVCCPGYLVFGAPTILPFVGRQGNLALVAQVLIGLRIASQAAIALLALFVMWFLNRRGKQKIALNLVAITAIIGLFAN